MKQRALTVLVVIFFVSSVTISCAPKKGEDEAVGNTPENTPENTLESESESHDGEPVVEEPSDSGEPVEGTEGALGATDCHEAKNVCPDYGVMWVDGGCPSGERCISFVNSCDVDVTLSYQIGCNGDGSSGAPQCACTAGPILSSGETMYWRIVDGDYTSCLPSWEPPCLTAGLAVTANTESGATCATGTRIEFSAGNSADAYGHFDSYNLSVIDGFSMSVSFAPALTCASDHFSHDCRPLWCGDARCPDAYADPTSGGCADGRSPQGGCQDTFGGSVGYTVEYCPSGCDSDSCPSCEDATPCGG